MVFRAGLAEPLYLLDRWYSVCWFDGRELPEETLSFVGPGFQCYSVVTASADLSTLYENVPRPDAARAWALPDDRGVPVLFGHDTESNRRQSEQKGYLRKIAERMGGWVDSGLAPLTDTSTSTGLDGNSGSGSGEETRDAGVADAGVAEQQLSQQRHEEEEEEEEEEEDEDQEDEEEREEEEQEHNGVFLIRERVEDFTQIIKQLADLRT